MHSEKKIGLALSGGGYRAAIYHLGTLKKLESLGVLSKIDKLSTISGGSITGAVYCLHQGDFESFEKKMFNSLTTKNVIKYVLSSWKFIRFALATLLVLISFLVLQVTSISYISIPILAAYFFVLLKYQFEVLPISEIIEEAYNEFFFDGAVLSDLHDHPEVAIGSTNLQTQRQFTFSKRKMEDSTYAYMKPSVLFDGSQFPVARAVIASSCVPFAFTPVVIDKIFYKNPGQFGMVDPRLVDGGVYDNQGAHKLTQKGSSYKCDIVIISDAGNKLPFEKFYNNTFILLLRTVDLFMTRIKHFQMVENLYKRSKIIVSFQSIGWDLENCIRGFSDSLEKENIRKDLIEYHELREEWLASPREYKEQIINHLKDKCAFANISSRGLDEEQLQKMRKVGTNLTPIKMELAKDLMTHAELITELQIRLYCPEILENNAIRN